jgi:hypothetical protein
MYKIWSEKLKGRASLEEPGVDSRIVLKLTLKKYGRKALT